MAIVAAIKESSQAQVSEREPPTMAREVDRENPDSGSSGGGARGD
jgi:hypothetical protein